MAICRPEAIDAAPACGPEQSGGWRRDDFLASRGMGEAQGKKVEPPPLRLRRSRRSRPLARSAKREAVGRAPNSILGRSRGQPEGTCARGPALRAKRRRSWRRKRTASSQPNRSQTARLACLLSSAPEERPTRSGHRGLRSPVASRRAFTAPISPTCSMIGDAKSVSDPGRAAARQQASKRPRYLARPAA
ncbi:MAG: hypothetical protein FD144_1960 [Rhodospirillaceae bacterium]|nr:MAG: hypothetical protein FD144_1960 [Rhodospirillaceae bacterium]